MSRRRYVSTVISQDTRVNKLAVQYGDFAALLYTWMIPHATDDATLPGDPEELLYQVLPGRRDKSVEEVSEAVAGMLALGLLTYCHDQSRLIFPTKAFYRYQTYIKDRNKHRDDDAAETAQPEAPSQPEQTDSAHQRTSAQNTVSFSPSSPPSVKDSPSVRDYVLQPVDEVGGADAPRQTQTSPRLIRPAPKPKDEPPRKRQPDPLFDAVCETCGIDHTLLTETERGKVNAAVGQIRKAGATPVDVPIHGEHYRLHFTTPLTPMALAGNWSKTARPPDPPPESTVRAAHTGRAPGRSAGELGSSLSYLKQRQGAS
jgi:hypothetical protein